MVIGTMAETLHTVGESVEPPAPDYSEDGVDLSLIRWFLSLTPAERLQFAQRHVNGVLAIRELNAGK
jgi:hypothetical protein